MHLNPFEYQRHATNFDSKRFAPQSAEKSHAQKNYSGRHPLRHDAMPFDPHRIHTSSGAKEFMTGMADKKKLEKIFRSGDIEEITELIKTEDSWSPEFKNAVDEIEGRLHERLTGAKLTRKDWAVLAAIEIFDRRTMEHSIGTFELAKNKIENRIKELGHDIEKENVILEQFYRSCLFHDIGKLAIPEFILNNKTTDEEWAFHFNELSENEQEKILSENGLGIPANILGDLEKLTRHFYENRIRAVKFVPIRSVLDDEKIRKLRERNIDCDQPLGKIMQEHEKKSEEILGALGYEIEAVLAGHHHNYKYKDSKHGEKPVSFSTLHISTEIVSSIMHLADVQNALSHDRPYHLRHPKLRILAFLVDDAEKGIIDKKTAAKWIADEKKEMSPDFIFETKNLLAKRQHHEYILARKAELDKIEDFLQENLSESEQEKIPAAA